MAWVKRLKRCNFVDYWLIIMRTNLVTNAVSMEHYYSKSNDTEPNIFIDENNENKINKDLWTPVSKDVLDEAEPELMRTELYSPENEFDDNVKTERVYLFSFREERVLRSERSAVTCASCEFYEPVCDSSGKTPCGDFLTAKGLVSCDFRNGTYYYCPGYADAKTCRECRLKNAASKGRCMFHAVTDSVTGITKGGDCSQWNRCGECEDYSEKFSDEDRMPYVQNRKR